MVECLSQAEVAAVAAGKPPSRDRAILDAHLALCDSCRERVRAVRAAPDGASVTQVAPNAGSPNPSQPKTAPLPQPAQLIIEGYDVFERIQGGGQGVVFKAMQKSTSRLVAVKILPHEETASARQKQRFEREVSLAASLRHPGIVTIYDSGLTSGRYFFAMEYVHGKPLDEFARDLDLNAKLGLFAKVCDAVAHAHQQNVVHRDLKPANVLVDARGEPHVLDFGLAKTAGSALLVREGDGSAGQPMTLTSQFMGTLAYASPEQTMGDPMLVDRRSDVYSLGVMLFEMLTGRFPYAMPGDLVGTFEAIRHTPPRKPSELDGARGIDRDLDTIVLRALAKEPARRYQSAEDLASDVHRYLAGEPVAARRDSALYVTTIRARAALRRHPVLTAAGVIALATLAGRSGADLLLRAWPAPGQWFEYAAGASAQATAAPGAFDSVRIVPITEQTQELIGELASAAGLSGVSADDWTSVRRAHGLFMHRLADAGAQAVIWDITFIHETEFDADFARGVQALRVRKAGVVVALDSWDVPDPADPPIAPAIRDARVLWGGNSINVDDVSAWKIDLVVRQPDGVLVPSLSLAALSAAQQPGMDPVTSLDGTRELVELQYRALDSSVMQAVKSYRTVTLSAVRSAAGEDDDLGIQTGARIGLLALPLPPVATLDAATKPYHEVFAMSPTDLAAWCGGKVLLLCDYRQRSDGSYDRYPAADRRDVWGGEAHAVAIDALLRGAVPARYPRPLAYTIVIALAAGLGVVAAHRRWGRSAQRVVMLMVLLAAVAVIGVLAYRVTGYLCHPMAALLAMILAFAAWLWLDRMHTWRLESPVAGKTSST